MEINIKHEIMSKTARGNIGITRFLRAGAKGTLNYTMRFGKTRLGIRLIHRYSKSFNKKIVIVVPSQIIFEQWKTEIDEYSILNDDFKPIIILTTTNSIFNGNYNLSDVGLLVIDEIHKFTSDARHNIIDKSKFKYDYILGLTGTYPSNDKVINDICPIVDTITKDEAIKNNWISEYEEYNIGLELTDRDKSKYIEYTNNISKILNIFKIANKRLTYKNNTPIFKNNFDLIMACYRGGKINNKYIKSYLIREALAIQMGWSPELELVSQYNNNINDTWNPDAIKHNVNVFYKAMTNRNNIHNINEIKLETVLKLYSYYYKDNKNIVTFNENIEMADLISDSVNNLFKEDKAISYHSKIKSRYLKDFETKKLITTKAGKPKKFGSKSQLKYIIEGFKLGKYNMINSVKSLDTGFNVENINLIITTSGTCNPIQYAQRIARGMTLDPKNSNKKTIVINLYFMDFIDKNDNLYHSKDKIKLKLRQNNNNIPNLGLNDFINMQNKYKINV